MTKAANIQYKFILPASTKHSSYSYQKLFRAMYGYTQNVTKSSGKTYIYHRDGVLSDIPFVREGKNSIVVPSDALQKVINFFKTGKNPAHLWRDKGDWKAVYEIKARTLTDDEVSKAIDCWLDNTYILDVKGHDLLFNQINQFISNPSKDSFLKNLLLEKSEKIVSNDWFKTAISRSNKAKEFDSLYQKLKSL